ncbi:MAG: CDP-glucose 4,6-dehydratase [Romboutsia sp.]|uniref:CDP-glucose 4,6-dehydratase n=1 Tax=Romboutsia sp. TaxID=1965302 RepID=UPI003F2E8FDE
MQKNFWKDKTVLVTGHTGFKGSWLCIYLLELGAKVVGYALDPKHEKDNYNLCNLTDKITDIRGDIIDINLMKKTFDEYKPDVVFHLAAQPLVIESYKNPYATYEVNVLGTLNVLECIKNIPKKTVGIMITTDKCYENKEHPWGYRENDTLGGYDMYSSSKACCEILISSFRNSFLNIDDYKNHQTDISSVRAGNVIGGGDWSDYRLIPDCVKALESNEKVVIRSPHSVRPWQHVLEPVGGYILLAEKMYESPLKYTGAYNFGPNIDEVVTVENLAKKIAKSIQKDDLLFIEENNDFHEANLLFLDISKAKFELGWKPVLNIDETIDFTMDWYKYYKNKNVYDICKKQIQDYHMLITN